MNLTFVNARLIDPLSGQDGPGALRVVDGAIADVAFGHAPEPGDGAVIDCGAKVLAPGIVDMRVFVGEPGARHRESYRSAGAAAAAGGVTTFVAQPDTNPPLDDPALVQFALARAREAAPVRVHAMGALTKGLRGTEMTEQRFLLDAGAIALTDADHTIESAKVMRAVMLYATSTGALVVHHPQEPTLSRGTCATSGEFASRLGLPSVGPVAERIALARDLMLAQNTGARYHADMVTTATGLDPLRRAKEAGVGATAGVSIHHLTLNEFDIADYRSFFKFDPPLRSEDDRQAAVEAVASGLIDVIVSSHEPWDEEAKRLPFEEAAPGAVGLETFLPACMRLVHGGQLSLVQLFRAASLRPSEILGLPSGRLTRGAPADLVLFDPNAPFLLDRERLASRSKNTPFDRHRMEGRVIGTWVAGDRVFGGSDAA
ncbi:dihydroorotase [Limibaculum sp. M0105]|uniref:Dihydroorotase n=1 Tax=Thermohalobaculum xanthum TaxID=2753746 RepID=A0A8J7MAI9_9RHOB|nr:dihydroorotase [Thermohalobaculum xanthum]MBK0401243.1 dihydroorotase [Thermohalobaculum xanthum]